MAEETGEEIQEITQGNPPSIPPLRSHRDVSLMAELMFDNNFLDSLSEATVKRISAPANIDSSAIISPGLLTGSTNEPKPSKRPEPSKLAFTPGEASGSKKGMTNKGKRPVPSLNESEHHPSNKRARTQLTVEI